MGEILYIHGRLGKYLEPSQGKARMNIVEMAKEEIKLQLSSAIQNAISTNKEVVLENLKVNEEEINHKTHCKTFERIQSLLVDC